MLDQELNSYSLLEEANTFLSQLRIHWENARLAISRVQETQAKYYNKGQKKAPEFEPGSLVLVNPHSLEWKESKGKGSKLIQQWISPFKVLEKINPKVYQLHMSNKYPRFPVFNIDHLKAYHESTEIWKDCTMLPETREQEHQEEYKVESIVGHRRRGGKPEFLVRWKGYGPQFDTWAMTADLKNAPKILRTYKKVNQL